MRALCCFALMALAGSAHAYNIRGDRWAIGPTDHLLYRIHDLGSADVSGDSELDAVEEMFQRWENVECAPEGEHPNLRFERGPNAEDRTDGGSPSDLVFDNRVFWLEDGADWRALGLGDDTLAFTYNVFDPVTGQVVDADIRFNGDAWEWATATSSNCATPRCADVATVALHEIGHFIGLDHVPDETAVMFARTDLTIRRELTPDEVAAACDLYPPAAQGDFGTLCISNPDCEYDGGVCALSPALDGAGYISGYCTQPCVGDRPEECPEGWLCETEGTDDYPVEDPFCRPGHRPGGGDLCEPCSDGAGCLSGLCVRVTNFGPAACGIDASVCTEPCDISGACPTGFDCMQTDQAVNMCVPRTATCEGVAPHPEVNHLCGLPQGAPDASGTQACELLECAADMICAPWLPTSEADPCGCFGDSVSSRYQPICIEYCTSEQGICRSGFYRCDTELPQGLNPGYGLCLHRGREGEACLRPDEFYCDNGYNCISDGGSLRCAALCDPNAEGSCDAGQDCVPSADSSFNLCYPLKDPPCRNNLGEECESNADCITDNCATTESGKVCTQPCDPDTSAGCDVTEFRCSARGEVGACLPRGDIREGQCDLGDDDDTADDDSADDDVTTCDDVTIPCDDDGCGCNGGSPAPLALWLLTLLAFRRRRPSTK